MTKISPSMLASDFSSFGTEILRLEKAGADWVHLDIMDGVFVPSITFGAGVVKSLRNKVGLVFDVHLMIVEPSRHIKDFVDAGADIITFHYESCNNVKETLDLIHSYGIKAGIALKPDTPASVVEPLLDKLDMILVMTVEPGRGGQPLIEHCLDKIEECSKMVKKSGRNIEIQADGGIYVENVKRLLDRGLTVVVAGSAVFKSDDPAKTVELLRTGL